MNRRLPLWLLCLSLAIPAFGQAGSLAAYRNLKCGFSFTYPANLVVQEKPIPSKGSDPGCSLELDFFEKGEKKHSPSQVFSSVRLRVEKLDFDEAAQSLEFKRVEDHWEWRETAYEVPEEISGPAWKGLSLDYSARCYTGPGGTYEATGDGYLGFAASDKRTLIIDGGACASGDAYQWVVGSLKFLP